MIALSRSTLNILVGSKLTKWKHAHHFPRTASNFPQFLAGPKMIRITDECRQADQTKRPAPKIEKALARGCVAWAAHSTLLAWTKPRRSGPQLNKTWRNVDMPRILGLYPILLADHLPLWISFYPEICYRSRARILSKTPFYSWCVPPCRRC